MDLPPGGGGVLFEISVYKRFWPKLVYLGPPQAGFFLVYKSFRYENSVFKLFRQCIYNALLRVGAEAPLVKAY